MLNHLQYFFILVAFSILQLTLGATYCAIDNPKFKNAKDGYIFGIPARGKSNSVNGSRFPYIIPVDNVDAPPQKSTKNKVYSLGLYKPERFKPDFVPLKEFLETRKIPSYVKFVFLNGKDLKEP